jgi:hypothetical protein
MHDEGHGLELDAMGRTEGPEVERVGGGHRGRAALEDVDAVGEAEEPVGVGLVPPGGAAAVHRHYAGGAGTGVHGVWVRCGRRRWLLGLGGARSL